MPLLEISSLAVDYRTSRGTIHAVEYVSFSLEKGETLGLAGESGSGKSTLGLSIIRLVPYPGVIAKGRIKIGGKDILKLPENEMRSFRGRKVAYVFQDPMVSLSPVERIGAHFTELISTHEPKTKKEEAFEHASDILKNLGLSSLSGIYFSSIAFISVNFSGGTIRLNSPGKRRAVLKNICFWPNCSFSQKYNIASQSNRGKSPK